jgi:K+-sensing histidine kinase KdpD
MKSHPSRTIRPVNGGPAAATMTADRRNGVWLPAGILGAIALGLALIPLRTATSASNLAFVFLAFVIVVAEFGGRTVALAAAVVSAMSLNFFLTVPYLTLAISKIDDLIAFLAMIVCGLIAAAFGSRRERLAEAASRTRRDLQILRHVLEPLQTEGSLEGAVNEVRRAFGLGRLVLRDVDGRVAAVTPTGADAPAWAEAELNHETLFAAQETRHRFGIRGLRLPEGGGRLRLPTERGVVTLDLWEGDAQGLDHDARQALAVAASILSIALARRGSSPVSA